LVVVNRSKSLVMSIVGVFVLLTAGLAVVPSAPAAALSGSDFLPGYIISDSNFFDANSMNVGDIQNFLNAQVPNCAPVAGTPCLRNYSATTTSKAGTTGRCSNYTGAANESAATIIYRVGQACGISPKVILVTLQKEEGLITSRSPTPGQYKIAMGYGCPDTAACDTTYYGFFNQVWSAARQFRTYTATASSWNYHIGNVVVPFSPIATCVKGTVYIQNQATANLYNYTPYQPNTAALNNLRGSGDSCSAYGNRNFWVYYNDWFGSPTGFTNPYGNVDSVKTGPLSATITGWAIDPDSDSPINVHVYVDGVFSTGATANLNRPDVAALGHGSAHGFSTTITGLAPGARQVCVYGINVSFGINSLISCQTVSGQSGSPFGSIDSAVGAVGAITVSGWTIDPDTSQPANVQLVVDGNATASVPANVARDDVGAAYPGYGTAHGFSVTAAGLSGGNHSVCLNVSNQGAGADKTIWCSTVAVPSGPPKGYLDSVSASGGVISVSGWALDPDTAAPISTQIFVDGQQRIAITSDGDRPDIAAAFAGMGAKHGFAGATSAAPGSHSVCAIAINVGLGSNTSLGCRTVTMSTGAPIGHVDTTTAASGTVAVTGWALDPDSIDPIGVHVYVDGQLRAMAQADGDRPDVAALYSLGSRHGFAASVVPLAAGNHTVCVYAINVGPPLPNPIIGCSTITVPQ
jgi:hypothetical protein